MLVGNDMCEVVVKSV